MTNTSNKSKTTDLESQSKHYQNNMSTNRSRYNIIAILTIAVIAVIACTTTYSQQPISKQNNAETEYPKVSNHHNSRSLLSDAQVEGLQFLYSDTSHTPPTNPYSPAINKALQDCWRFGMNPCSLGQDHTGNQLFATLKEGYYTNYNEGGSWIPKWIEPWTQFYINNPIHDQRKIGYPDGTWLPTFGFARHELEAKYGPNAATTSAAAAPLPLTPENSDSALSATTTSRWEYDEYNNNQWSKYPDYINDRIHECWKYGVIPCRIGHNKYIKWGNDPKPWFNFEQYFLNDMSNNIGVRVDDNRICNFGQERHIYLSNPDLQKRLNEPPVFTPHGVGQAAGPKPGGGRARGRGEAYKPPPPPPLLNGGRGRGKGVSDIPSEDVIDENLWYIYHPNGKTQKYADHLQIILNECWRNGEDPCHLGGPIYVTLKSSTYHHPTQVTIPPEQEINWNGGTSQRIRIPRNIYHTIGDFGIGKMAHGKDGGKGKGRGGYGSHTSSHNAPGFGKDGDKGKGRGGYGSDISHTFLHHTPDHGKGGGRGKGKGSSSVTAMDAITKDLTMDDVTRWTRGNTIFIISDFEYDDIVAIGGLMMNIMENLGMTIHELLPFVEIVYFADNRPLKKDSGGIWMKKLAMARYFLPSLYDKISVRWREGVNVPTNCDRPQFNAETYVSRMKQNIDIIILSPGHDGLKDISYFIKRQNKNINSVKWSIGKFNAKYGESEDNDLKTLFEWSKNSLSMNGKLIDSSRFPWMHRQSSPGGIHEIGGQHEMSKILYQVGGDNGYRIVMDYLKQFNSDNILKGLPNIGDKYHLVQELQNQFEQDKYEKVLKIVATTFCQQGKNHAFPSSYNCPDINNPNDGRYNDPNFLNPNQWKLSEIDSSGYAQWKFKKLLKVIDPNNNEPEDGPAADPVMTYWHMFPNQHGLSNGFMPTSGDRFMRDGNPTYQHESYGPMVQIRLLPSNTPNPNLWQQMFRKSLSFKDHKL